MRKCYAYLRVSGKIQIVGSGFDRQLDTIRKHCSGDGYEIAKVFREQVSGTKDESHRPEFLAMISEIMADGTNVIVVEALDRLSRTYAVQEQLLIYLASKGITLIAANTGEDVTAAIRSDPMKKALVQIQGIFAELDKSQLVARLRKGRERKHKTGWKEGPPGYGTLPGEAAVLKKISYMRRKRRNRKNLRTFKDIASQLNDEGILTRSGGRWSASLAANILANSRKRNGR